MLGRIQKFTYNKGKMLAIALLPVAPLKVKIGMPPLPV